ncbi:unnamed protein product, partial [Ixodes pacificus]
SLRRRIPQKYIPCFHGPLEIRQLALIVVSAGLAIFWVVIRHQSYSWMLQNFFGMMFGINLLKSLRMPSLMILFWMLVLLFVYDIFFVFLTPYITKRGDSIMVEVAKGTDSREMIPMVLRVPRMINKEMEACVSRYALLGYGDIIIPGEWALIFALVNPLTRVQKENSEGVSASPRGTCVAFPRVILTHTLKIPQWIFLSCHLFVSLLDFVFLYTLQPLLSELEDAPAPSAEKTSQPEEDEGPRLAHGNKRLSREPYVQQQPYAHGPHGQGLYGPDARSQMWPPT